MNMKVSILTEGGRKIGFGHIARCIALADAFEERQADIKFIINSDNSVRDFFKTRSFKKLDWARHYDRALKLIGKPDFIVIDSYLADKDFYRRLYKGASSTLIIIDDYRRIDYAGGIVINPSVYGDEIRYPDNKDVHYLLGEKYIILRKDFWRVAKPAMPKNIKNILITFGGAEQFGLFKRVVSYLEDRFKYNIYAVDASKGPVSSKKILNLMLKADICVSGGGQTTYELARAGIPTIGICLSDNQERNLKKWDDIGFIKYIGWHNDANLLENLGKAITALKDLKIRREMSWEGRRRVDGKGAFRIIDSALNIRLGSLDFVDILKTKNEVREKVRLWRNKKDIREKMLSSHIISKEEHCKWLETLSGRDDSKAWVVFSGDAPIGLVSLRDIDRKKLSAEWGFYIGEDSYRGRGFGKLILSKLLHIFFEEMGFNSLETYVLADNIAALGLYKKFGFKINSRKTLSGGKKVFRLVKYEI